MDLSSTDTEYLDEAGSNQGLFAFGDTSETDSEVPSLEDASLVNVAISDSNRDIFTDLAVATDNPYDCSGPLSLLSRRIIRVRGLICNNPDASHGAEDSAPKLTTEEEVQDYWCSESHIEGFGNIPVCSRAASERLPSEWLLALDAPPPFPQASRFQNLLTCSLSEFMLLACPRVRRQGGKNGRANPLLSGDVFVLSPTTYQFALLPLTLMFDRKSR